MRAARVSPAAWPSQWISFSHRRPGVENILPARAMDDPPPIERSALDWSGASLDMYRTRDVEKAQDSAFST